MTDPTTPREPLPDGVTESEATKRVEELLEGGVPLTLLVDLFGDDVPPSTEILETEGLPDEAWWEEPGGEGRAGS